MFWTKAKPLAAGASTDELRERINDLEGQIIRLTSVVKAVQKVTQEQDLIAPHLATLSMQIEKFSKSFNEIDRARRDMQSMLDVVSILRHEKLS